MSKFQIEGALGETEVPIDSEGTLAELLDQLLAPVKLTWKLAGTCIGIQPAATSAP
jgi:hypothetical protein